MNSISGSPPLRTRGLSLLLAFALCLHGTVGLAAQDNRAPVDVSLDSLFAGMNARSIGPAGTSGRVASLAVDPRDERVIYVGAATGGLWKSTDGGFAWTPIMDEEPVNSIGALAVSPSAPDIVWVGSGEANARNSMGVGRGVWKSLDGGSTWAHMGLERTERIEAIVVHPTDPHTAWLSALGPAWSDGAERGVFKTTDGGESWEKVLFVDETTGAFELVIDPSNPEHLLASTWEFRRWPWFFRSGGAGSGLWSSWDGGDTWDRMTSEDGLPEGELGRIGLAFATNDPKVAYALVEAEKSALLRSDDGGKSWRTVNSDTGVNARAFYYSRIYVDPSNENRVYRVSGDLDRSDDGGRTFQTVAQFTTVHVDHHAFYASPDGHSIITGNDGGVFVSNDRGGAWRFVENLPLSQFYHLSVDNAVPFNVYGGLQDNGSWMAPSQVWETPSFKGSNLMNRHWTAIGFGDGFAALIDPDDPVRGYSMSQGGSLQRFDLATGEWAGIRPPAPDADTRLRFNWNAGIALDPFDPAVVYYGSQFLHRSADRGATWEIISPDLTTDDPEKQKQAESGGLTLDVTAAENHTSILTIAPSTLDRQVIWVGTDDGNVQVTRDGGTSWQNVVGNIDDGPPEATWVPHIEASKHDAATAYVVFDNHRRGDWTTYVYTTVDYGRNWEALAPDQIDGYLHVIEEDPVEPNLLFLGSELGLYFSVNGGEDWMKWTHGGYPAGAATRALVVHPRDHDLAIGTHGRGAWIIDDIQPLRMLAQDATVADEGVQLSPIPEARQHTRGITGPFLFPGDTKFQGENRPYGAVISYWVSADAAAVGDSLGTGGGGGGGPAGFAAFFGGGASSGSRGPATIEVLQGDSVIRSFKGPAARGVNRTMWGLERKGITPTDADEDATEPSGPAVLPGTYRVRVSIGDFTSEASVDVVADARRPKSVAVIQANLEVFWRGQQKSTDLQVAIRRLGESRRRIEFYESALKDWDAPDEELRDSLVTQAGAVKDQLNELLDRMRLSPTSSGIVENNTVSSRLGQAIGEATGSPYRPSSGRIQQLDWIIADVDAVLTEVDAFYSGVFTRFREAVDAARFEPLGGE